MVTVASSDSNAMSYNEYYAQYQQPAGLSSYASSYPEPASAYPTPQQYAGAQTAAGKGGGGGRAGDTRSLTYVLFVLCIRLFDKSLLTSFPNRQFISHRFI